MVGGREPRDMHIARGDFSFRETNTCSHKHHIMYMANTGSLYQKKDTVIRINFVRKYLKYFHVTMLSSISCVCHIFTTYNTIGK